MAIAIVDPGCHLVYFEKMQDTQTGSVDLAIEKARTSALFRRPTKVFQDAVAAGGDGLRVLRLTGTIGIMNGRRNVNFELQRLAVTGPRSRARS